MGFFLKSPASRLDYAVDRGAGYLNGATIVASDWSVAPDEPDGGGGRRDRRGARTGGGDAGGRASPARSIASPIM